jgi:hypothetical protein
MPPAVARRATLPLVLAAVLVWVAALWFTLAEKRAFLDDTFIALHVAGNVLDAGTARFFPVAGSAALLTSSPLRLLVLVPSTLLARLAADPDRGLLAARLTLAWSGVLTSLLFLPFFRGRRHRWLAGAVVAGLAALSTESALQMEGLLLVWIVWTALCLLHDLPPGTGRLRRLGILTALLVLARPEYGLAGIVLGAAHALAGRRARNLLAWALPLAIAGLAWIAVALLLDVYPLPTSWLSKVMTAEAGLNLAGDFTTTAVARLRAFFAFGAPVPAAVLVLGAAAVVILLATVSGPSRWAAAFLLLLLPIVRLEDANYLWYHENLYLVALTAIAAALVLARDRGVPGRPALLRRALLALPLAAFLGSNLGRDRPLFWDFAAERSRGTAYRAVGEAHIGDGLFAFGDLATCYLAMGEIGIASYFAGPRAWILDLHGLAQPGRFADVGAHPLARLYPDRLWRRPEDEFAAVRTLRPDGPEPPVLLEALGAPDPGHVASLCDWYDPGTGVCLRWATSVSAGP